METAVSVFVFYKFDTIIPAILKFIDINGGIKEKSIFTALLIQY